MNTAREIALLNKNHKVYASWFSFPTQEEQRELFLSLKTAFCKNFEISSIIKMKCSFFCPNKEINLSDKPSLDIR